MAFLKINGFHTTNSGRTDGIGDFLRKVDAAGVPFLAYCADGTTSLVDAQNIMKTSSVLHNAIFRRTHFPGNQGNSDVPDYSEEPAAAARKQWLSHRNRWPNDLDKDLIYGETINELRKERHWADWIGEFCYQTGLLALADGFKWCGPGYSSGTPDVGAWDTPGMLRYLDLCQQYPDRLAIALHEYSFSEDDILRGDGDLIGRCTRLIDACARHGIQPPAIFFTEWGWAERDVPAPDKAMQDILKVGKLYAEYPSIKGSAIWALDGGWGSLADQTWRLMKPLQKLLAETRFPDPQERPFIPKGTPRAQFERTYLTAPSNATLDEWLAICRRAYPQKQTVGFSYDDAGIGSLGQKTAVLYGIAPSEQGKFIAWYREHYPGTHVVFRAVPVE